jgi:DNA invertase Pin-like site-specific DNA recombinase
MARREKQTAVAYFRTSSAANVGPEKDSLVRQQDAVRAYAAARGLEIVREFYDAAVSGADAIDIRPGFLGMLTYMRGNGARTILVENASRFARDLTVQLVGHDMLKREGIELVPVDAPDHFLNETPTAVMVGQILGAVSQFEKAALVEKLRRARQRVKAEKGRCEGRKPVPADVVVEAKRLYRQNPKTHTRPSLRQIAAGLVDNGMVTKSGAPYSAAAVRRMLLREARQVG